MKKIAILTVMFFLFAACVHAATWHKSNANVIVWDAPTTLATGEPIPSDWILKYYIYIKNKDGSNEEFKGDTTDTQYAVILNPTDKKYVGVSVVGIDPDELMTDESPINWSDNPENCLNGDAFGIYFLGVIDFKPNMGPQ